MKVVGVKQHLQCPKFGIVRRDVSSAGVGGPAGGCPAKV